MYVTYLTCINLTGAVLYYFNTVFFVDIAKKNDGEISHIQLQSEIIFLSNASIIRI